MLYTGMDNDSDFHDGRLRVQAFLRVIDNILRRPLRCRSRFHRAMPDNSKNEELPMDAADAQEMQTPHASSQPNHKVQVEESSGTSSAGPNEKLPLAHLAALSGTRMIPSNETEQFKWDKKDRSGIERTCIMETQHMHQHKGALVQKVGFTDTTKRKSTKGALPKLVAAGKLPVINKLTAAQAYLRDGSQPLGKGTQRMTESVYDIDIHDDFTIPQEDVCDDSPPISGQLATGEDCKVQKYAIRSLASVSKVVESRKPLHRKRMRVREAGSRVKPRKTGLGAVSDGFVHLEATSYASRFKPKQAKKKRNEIHYRRQHMAVNMGELALAGGLLPEPYLSMSTEAQGTNRVPFRRKPLRPLISNDDIASQEDVSSHKPSSWQSPDGIPLSHQGHVHEPTMKWNMHDYLACAEPGHYRNVKSTSPVDAQLSMITAPDRCSSSSESSHSSDDAHDEEGVEYDD